jgi:CelD/BcsL family acetyltransferase involved in cellulose biosynthesis
MTLASGPLAHSAADEPAAAPSPSSLTVEVVSDDHGFDGLRDEWEAAALVDPDPNVFLTWPWARTWWRQFGDGHRLHIVVVRDADGVVAIAPLCRARLGRGPVATTVLQRLAHDAGDYGGVILARRAPDATAALIAHLGEQLRSGVSAVVLSRLPSDAQFTGLLGDQLRDGTQGIEPTVDVLGGGTCLFTDVRQGFDLAKQAKKHKVRQRMRRLEEQHSPVAFVEHTGETLETGLDRLVSLHDRRWEQIDEPMQGLLADDARRAFLLDAIRSLDAGGNVRLLTLEAGGRAVGVELDFAYRDRLFLFKGAIDPDFGAFSPGQLLHHKVFEDGLADDVVVFDFCRGDALYKRRWTNGERHLVTVTLTKPGLAGSVGRLRLRAARALSRRLDTPSHTT